MRGMNVLTLCGDCTALIASLKAGGALAFGARAFKMAAIRLRGKRARRLSGLLFRVMGTGGCWCQSHYPLREIFHKVLSDLPPFGSLTRGDRKVPKLRCRTYEKYKSSFKSTRLTK